MLILLEDVQVPLLARAMKASSRAVLAALAALITLAYEKGMTKLLMERSRVVHSLLRDASVENLVLLNLPNIKATILVRVQTLENQVFQGS